MSHGGGDKGKGGDKPKADAGGKGGYSGPAAFAIDFAMGGVSAAVSKTAAAPIERVKLLIQNQVRILNTGISEMSLHYAIAVFCVLYFLHNFVLCLSNIQRFPGFDFSLHSFHWTG